MLRSLEGDKPLRSLEGDGLVLTGADVDFGSQKAECLELCSKMMVEIKKDLLRVNTTTITKSDEFSTRATVRSIQYCYFMNRMSST